jgi:hypothetical protein
MASNNSFPRRIIQDLREKLAAKKDRTVRTQTPQPLHNKWITFTYHGPSVHKISNLFKRANMKIAFRPTNTIYQQLSQKPKENNPRGIYQLKCNTCNRAYAGQSGGNISTRHKEHIRYIRSNNPTSAYATHILQNRHEYGPAERTLKLLKPCKKGKKMDYWETLFIHMHHKQDLLISEQHSSDTNPLFELAVTPHSLHNIPPCSTALTDTIDTHTKG